MTDVNIPITTGVGADTYINKNANTRAYGGQSSLTILQATVYALMRFDLSSIPATATCTAATLKAYISYAATGANPSTFSAYKITDANGDWIEGTSANPASAGDPCWNAKEADGSGGVTTAWAGSAGLSTAGTDYVDTVIAEVTMATRAAGDPCNLVFNASGLAVLQDWFGDANNNGLLIKSTSYRSDWHSKESATEAYRPVLSITYTEAGGVKRMNGVHRINSINQIRHIGG